MLQPWRTGKVIRIEDETASTKRYWIQVPEIESFDFKPGQFVTLDLPIHEKPNKRWRSYSIASWPDGTNIFELVIVLVEDGLGTPYLFNQVKVGSELTLRGPQGVFILPEPIDRDLYFICTGTGIAPFRSMAHHIANHNVPHKNIYLIFGCRKFTDCLYGKEMRALEKELNTFKYIPTYSREEASDPAVRTGYVHAVYEELCRNSTKSSEIGEGVSPAYFYLCGWKNMIDEAKQKILALGYDKKSIHLELYG
ncbi:MAG TPA: FAD-dependent oxidoreductase [Flavitalea sp.]|nr:FAD-dependent oxidoreductase [Flavitalea sp.]